MTPNTREAISFWSFTLLLSIGMFLLGMLIGQWFGMDFQPKGAKIVRHTDTTTITQILKDTVHTFTTAPLTTLAANQAHTDSGVRASRSWRCPYPFWKLRHNAKSGLWVYQQMIESSLTGTGEYLAYLPDKWHPKPEDDPESIGVVAFGSLADVIQSKDTAYLKYLLKLYLIEAQKKTFQ